MEHGSAEEAGAGKQQPRLPTPNVGGGSAGTKLLRRSAWLLVVVGLGLTIVLPMALRAFVIEAFKIPSGGMFPTLEIGDHLFVLKSGYGSSNAPKRGEPVAFAMSQDAETGQESIYVQRVVGLPGDAITVEHDAPVINGFAVPRCPLGHATATLDEQSGSHAFSVFVEFLAGHAYLVVSEDERDAGLQGPYRVKPGEFFTLGDNRDNSFDSRAWRGGQGGGVRFENAKGRAWYLWLPSERLGIDVGAAPVLPKGLAALQPALAKCLAAAPSVAASTPPPPRP